MKNFFKTLLSAAAVGFTLFSFNASAAVDMTDPYKMVDAVAQKTFSDLKANKDKLSDVAFRKQLIREDLMPYVIQYLEQDLEEAQVCVLIGLCKD